MRLLAKRSLAILLSVLMLMSVMMIGTTSAFAAAGDTLYVVPNSNWHADNARFAAYFFSGDGSASTSDTWVNATAVEGEDNLYSVVIPEGGWKKVIFCRMNPGATANNWDNKWNQTSDLDVPTDGTNCYTVAEGAWDKGNGAWSTYVPGEEIPTAPSTEYVPEVLLKGSFPGNDWNGVEMTLVDGYYTYTYELEADSYEFKVQKDGDWLGNSGTIKDMTEDEGWTMNTDDQSNCTLKASGGTYTFKFNFDTNKLMVEATGLPETEPTQPTEAPEPTTVYFVNSGEWAEVCAHMWADGIGTTWPGVATEKTELTDANGYEVYSVTFTEAYTNIIFNNNDNGQQTSDEASAIQAGKYLNFADQTWYATLEEVPVVEETEPQPNVYTVAGSEELCGSFWNAEDTNNDMTDNADGTYTKVYSDVPAGEYEFKVVENRNWDTSYGDNNENIKFTVVESATITITFDANTKTVSYTKEGDAEAPTTAPAPKEYALIGYINGVDYDGTEYVFNEGKLTVEFEEQSYVAVKTTDDSKRYFAKEYCTNTIVILVEGAAEKMLVPAGKIEFTLAENVDGTLALSYEVIELATTAPEETTESTQPVVFDGYTLVGFINGQDVGIGGSASVTNPAYNFIDGTVTVEFDQVSYVCVKDDKFWYMTDGQLEEGVTTATLYEELSLDGRGNKLTIPAGTMKFNLVENEDGTLTLSYEIIELAETEPTESITPEPILVALMGDFADWESGIEMTETDGIYTTTVELSKGVYEFKIKEDDTWLGNNGTIKDTTIGAENGWEMTDAANCKLDATGGKYTFNYNAETNMLVVLAEIDEQPTEAPGPKEYTIGGNINGKNVADGDDWNTVVPEYTFVDNQVTITFTEISYVLVKTTDNANCYMTQGWLGEVTEAKLYHTVNTQLPEGLQFDKLQVPVGKVTFTLVENEDGTLTLSYVKEEEASSDPTPSSSEQDPSESDPTPSSSEQDPSESDPTPSSSEQDPSESDPTPSSSEQDPSESDPTPSSSEQDPSESETTPSSSETEPTEPKPTEPKPTETEPTEPKPTQPATKKPSIKANKTSLKAGQKATVKVLNAGKKTVKWSSSNAKVATVSSKGVVKAMGKGTAKITATIKGYGKLTCKINVTTSPKLYKGKKAVKKNQTFTIKKGKTLTLKINGKASGVNNKYATSKKKVAKVTSGNGATKIKIKGYKKGTAKITVTVNKKYKTTFKVKVK